MHYILNSKYSVFHQHKMQSVLYHIYDLAMWLNPINPLNNKTCLYCKEFFILNNVDGLLSKFLKNKESRLKIKLVWSKLINASRTNSGQGSCFGYASIIDQRFQHYVIRDNRLIVSISFTFSFHAAVNSFFSKSTYLQALNTVCK